MSTAQRPTSPSPAPTLDAWYERVRTTFSYDELVERENEWGLMPEQLGRLVARVVAALGSGWIVPADQPFVNDALAAARNLPTLELHQRHAIVLALQTIALEDTQRSSVSISDFDARAVELRRLLDDGVYTPGEVAKIDAASQLDDEDRHRAMQMLDRPRPSTLPPEVSAEYIARVRRVLSQPGFNDGDLVERHLATHAVEVVARAHILHAMSGLILGGTK